MLETDEVEGLRGRTVVGSDGEKIGKVDEVYVDGSSGRAEWALVNTGLFGLRSSFVLIADAHIDGDDLAVPFAKSTVKDAPSIDPDGALSPEEEAILFAHYGRDDYAVTEVGGTGGTGGTGAAGGTGSAVPVDAGATASGHDAPVEDGTPSSTLAAARLAREEESGLGGSIADSDGVGGERTQEDLDALRRGPLGETGRSSTEDPVPPDGGPPPRQDNAAGPPSATIGQETPDAASEGVEPTSAAPEPSSPEGESWEDVALPERGNATATPDHGPTSRPSERDVLEAPETPDAPGPGGSGVGARTRLRRFVADGGGDAARPGAADAGKDAR